MTTSKPAPPRPADMTREEAETLTQQIKGNFDSLGNMLLAARDRKAYKVLGYRSFESYCKTEFGKSSSTAYQAIEDVKIRSQLEARISENYGEEVTLKFPSSHLRPLKAVEDIDDKLRVIEYAQKLAESEGKKATKQHLEIAIFEISGKRSEDFKNAIQKLGFTKGVQVETLSALKKDRGIVTNIDKAGLIYVELYYGNNKSVPFRATELRILTNEEKPANPLEASITSKGDRVLIFAEGLQGKKGTIYSWKEGKTALVKIDGRDNDSPHLIAYAEMETIKKTAPKNATWDTELIWDFGKNTYYFSPEQGTIYSHKWPHDLSIQTPPNPKENNPAEFIQNWEEKSVTGLLESYMTPARAKTLALAQAIELPEEEGKKFAADLIASLSQLFPQPPSNAESLLQENERLREQIAEAEAAIRAMVSASRASASLEIEIPEPAEAELYFLPGGYPEAEAAPGNDFLLENDPETSSPGEAAPGKEFLLENDPETSSLWGVAEQANLVKRIDYWKQLLETKHFVPIPYRLDGFFKGSWRGWKFFFHPRNSGLTIIDLANDKKEMFTRCVEGDEDETIQWVKALINQIEDFSPGQLSLNLQPVKNITSSVEIAAELPPDISSQIPRIRNKLFSLIEKYEQSKRFASKRKEIENLDGNIKSVQERLKELEKFEHLRIGHTICHQRRPMILGKIIGFDFSQGEMPIVWVKYFKEGELEKTPTSELVSMIFTVNT
ncbi:hypothetical protein Q5692_18985 [Microcoleus sp. C2C3]|uniref:hypothetical protein n=1 Tax=unclassified Microcoleus TaxID=2642155 RepID=UPI002FD5220F